MNTQFISAANAIANYFKQLEEERGVCFSDTFHNALNSNAATPTTVGIPLALLRDLLTWQDPHGASTPDASAEPAPSFHAQRRKDC